MKYKEMRNFRVNTLHISMMLFLPCILFYSITPALLITVAILPLLFIYICRVKVDFVSMLALFFVISSMPALSQYFSVTESIRYMLLTALFLVFYYIGTQCTQYKRYYRILTFIFYCCAITVLYYQLSMSYIDGFVLEEGRKGYYAREYLLFGTKYDYTFGVTHLNIYTSFCVLYCLLRAILLKQKRWFIGVIAFSALAVLSESRGPVLFAVLSILALWVCLYTRKHKSFKFFYIVISGLILVLVLVVPVVWHILKDIGHSGDNRLLTAAATDVSRLIYFQLGIEHFIAKPFGNVLIYEANSVLQNYHNTFLTIANRNGAFAFISLILMIFISLTRTAKLLKTDCLVVLTIGPTLIYLYCLLFLNIEDVLRFDRFIYCLLAFQLGMSNRLNAVIRG